MKVMEGYSREIVASMSGIRNAPRNGEHTKELAVSSLELVMTLVKNDVFTAEDIMKTVQYLFSLEEKNLTN